MNRHLRYQNIVVFDQFGYIGGGQRVLLESISSFIEANLTVSLVAPKGGALESCVKSLFGSKVFYRHCPTPMLTHGKKGFVDTLRFIYHTVRLVVENWELARKSDAIYVNGPRWFLSGAILSCLANTKITYHLHLEHKAFQKMLIRLCVMISKNPTLIANSNYTAKMLRGCIDIFPRNTIITVENCLPSSFANRVFEDRFSNRGSHLQIAVFGVMRPEKGQNIAIEMAKYCPKVVLHLVGRIGEGAEAWAKNQLTNAPSNVIYHGMIGDIPAFISQNNIQVNLVPSIWNEPFGLTAIEGMACSCITVLSATGSLTEISQKTGAILYTGGAAELIQEIQSIQSLTVEDLLLTAKHQHLETNIRYSSKRYKAEFLAAAFQGVPLEKIGELMKKRGEE